MAKETKKIELKQTIEGNRWAEALTKAFNKKVKTVKVDGFREGKVPRDVYENKFGKESLYMDAIDEVINEAFAKAIEQAKIVPVIEPDVDIIKIDNNHVEFKFMIIPLPNVKVNKYKGLKVQKPEIIITDEEVQSEIDKILEKYAETKIKKGKLVQNNIAVIDFEGFKENVAFDGGKGENYSLEIGSNTFIPGFEEQLIGLSAGDSKDIKITFPDDYPSKDLANKEVVFKVKVNEVKEKITRKLDKELFEDLGMEGVDSKETLEKQLKEHLLTHKEVEIENKYIDDLLSEVSKNTVIDIPVEMINEEINHMIERYEEQLKMQGISLELYYEFTKTTEEDLRKQMTEEAKKHITYRLMLEEIKKIEKIEVTEDDLETEIKELMKKYDLEEEQLLANFGGKEMIAYDLQMRKLIELLKDYNK
ncbi:MAG: trigger factor [Tenericutes bacterium]|nr:trigger factor [Mycoplasmatota bacterium]